jgi:hypothetical protein
MDRAAGMVLPPVYSTLMVPAALSLGAALAMALCLGRGPVHLGPWEAAGHGAALAVLVLLFEDLRNCSRWHRMASAIGRADNTWASRALRLCMDRAGQGADHDRLLTEVRGLRIQLNRSLTSRWVLRYFVPICALAILGLAAGLFALWLPGVPSKGFLEVFRPTVIGSGEALALGAIAFLARISWEDVLETWSLAAVDR